MIRLIRKGAFLGLLAPLALGASSATGAVTVGSSLSATPGSGFGCPAAQTVCTAVQTAPAGQFVSPTDGIVVRWRVKTDGDGAGSSAKFRVIHPDGLAPSVFAGAGTSDPITMPDTLGVYSFDTRLPIKAGDRIGMDAQFALLNVSPGQVVGRQLDTWGPALPDGGAGSAPNGTVQTSGVGWELYVNADVEADADGDGFGDETQDRCPGVSGTAAGCLPETAAKKKKCKKRKKQRSAEQAKKKKCKKRKR